MRFTLGLFALVAMFGAGHGMMVAAQPAGQTPTQNIDVQDDRGNGFDLGWLGLLGLAGLMGMKRAESRPRSDSTLSSSAR